MRTGSTDSGPSDLARMQALLAVSEIVVVCLDAAGRVTEWNPAAEALHGRGREAVLGRDYCEIFLPAAIVPLVRAELYRVLAGEDKEGFDTEVVTGDGSLRSMRWNITRIEAAGQSVGIAFVGWDITERTRHLAEARQTADRFRAVMDQTSEMVFVADAATGTFVDVNGTACLSLGYTREEMLTLGPEDIGVGVVEDYTGWEAHVDNARHSEEAYVIRGRFRRKNGETIPVEASISTQRFHGREYVITLVRDLTERQALADKLVHAERQRLQAQAEARLLASGRLVSIGTLAAGVAHEINNPLAYVIGNLDYLHRELDRLAREPGLRELRQVIAETRDGTDRIHHIMRDIQLFSRANDEEGRDPIDVHEALNSAINLTRNEVSHRARLVLDYHQLPLARANASRLAQVFVNLLVNAAHAIPEGRSTRNEIRIWTGVELGRIAVVISDTGEGIPADSLGRIFDPFFTTKDVGEGTGLGLSICHGLIKAMDGHISVESEVGIGTVVRVTVPVAPLDDTAEAAQETSEEAARSARILLIDDEPPVARALARLLDRHIVTIATGGRHALEILEGDTPFDLVLCDLMLPDVNGVEIYYRVRERQPELAARFVFMTGGPFTDGTRDFVDKTLNPVVHKPFDLPEIEVLIRSMTGL